MGVTQERSELVLELFEAFYERVYCFVRKRAAQDEAEDITQEVFTRLLQSQDLEKKPVSVSYLIKIAHNLLKRRFRKSGQFDRYAGVAVNQRHGSSREAMESPRRLALEASVLEGAMECLTCDERDAMRLIVTEGLSYEHAARSLDVPTSTVNNWKHRGLHKLQNNEALGGPRD